MCILIIWIERLCKTEVNLYARLSRGTTNSQGTHNLSSLGSCGTAHLAEGFPWKRPSKPRIPWPGHGAHNMFTSIYNSVFLGEWGIKIKKLLWLPSSCIPGLWLKFRIWMLATGNGFGAELSHWMPQIAKLKPHSKPQLIRLNCLWFK